MRLIPIIRSALLAVALAYVSIAAYLYLKQEQLLFNPDRLERLPADVGIANAETVRIATPDGETLVAWYTPAADGKPTILFLHGKGGSISHRPKRYTYYTSHGFGVLFLSYRGYGGSTGTPSEKGLMIDAEAAYAWLIAKNVAPARIVAVGESLGTGIAVGLAARVQLAALALESPYVSMVAVASDRYWWLPVSLLISNPIDAGAVIGNYRGPVLMQHGDQDRTIPITIGRQLFDLANEPKQFVVVKGADHFIYAGETLVREIAFFKKVLALQ